MILFRVEIGEDRLVELERIRAESTGHRGHLEIRHGLEDTPFALNLGREKPLFFKREQNQYALS
jgi:hypothetical protein